MYQAELQRQDPRAFRKDPAYRPRLISLQEQLAGSARQASLVLLAMGAFVLLIACAGVAQLLLSRITERAPELAIRAALGASRARLVQQLITESVALTLAAAAAGMVVAHWACRLAATVQPSSLLSTQRYTVLDWRVLVFAGALAVLSGLVFGVLPAVLIGRTLRTHAGASSGAVRMRGALLALQTALAVVLVAGALSMGGAFLKLAGTDLGLRTRNVATLTVSLDGTREEPDAQARQYYQQALDRLRAVPGVESAGAADYLPLVSTATYGYALVLDSGEKAGGVPMVVSTGYFAATGTSLVAGRDFTEADGAGSPHVAIVNEEYARATRAGGGIVGHKISSPFAPPDDKPFTIVGVVRNTRFSPASEVESQFYFPVAQTVPSFATFVVRVRGNPEGMLPALRDALRQVDTQVPVYEVMTLDGRLRERLARPRFYTTAILFFSGFATLLAITGAYGAASYSIARRTHELGVRLAVGATAQGLRGMLLRQCTLPVAAGMLAGVAAAGALGRFLQHLVSSVQATNLAICAAAALALAIAVAAAVWNATGRILRMDPATVLRAE
jgi:predicted permease